MSGQGIHFVFDRLDEIVEELYRYGFGLDPRPGTSYVDPTYRAEPSTGLVEATARLEDSPLDVRVVLAELWHRGSDGAHSRRGLSVTAYTYWVGCVDPAIDLHYDLDPVRHPEMPFHWHPPAMTATRQPCGPVAPARPMQAAIQLGGRHRAAAGSRSCRHGRYSG